MQLIDNLEFAKTAQVLRSTISVQGLTRARDLLDELSGELSYALIGGMDIHNRATLQVEICGIITTLCQSCLAEISLPINHVWTVTIFETEADWMRVLLNDDASCVDGVLADLEFDVDSFIEDEIIMLLPISPKHEVCDSGVDSKGVKVY